MLSKSDLISEGIETALTVGTSLGTGIVHGRKGEMPSLGPVPLDAALGAGTLLLGLSGVAGRKGSRYLMDVSRGFLSYFGGSIGAQVGQKMRKDAGEQTGATVGPVGADGKPTSSGYSLSGTRTITKGLPEASGVIPGTNLTPAELARRVTGRY